MRALKLTAEVTKDHSVRLELPESMSEGPVEVIVLVPERDDPAAGPAEGTLDEFLSGIEVDPRFIRSKEEIDAYLEAERASWE